MLKDFVVRRASETDVKAIFELLEPHAQAGIVLRRSEADILFYIKNFRVVLYEGCICGCVAVRDFGADLLEVRSLVVADDFRGRGAGRALIDFVIKELNELRPGVAWHLFTLTGQPGFFERMGFRVVSKEMFPEKIWSDCSKCSKRNCCDETALLFEPHSSSR